MLIGILEILMAFWIISTIKPRLNTISQILIIGSMNLLEFILVPELLLWGKMNALFALMLIGLIIYRDFILSKKLTL